MTIDEKWLTREKWTLIEAALLCAGIEPYAGGAATDNPHEILQRISDPWRRELFSELYARSKDAIDGDSLVSAEGSRTGNVGNIRVRPSLYAVWALDIHLPDQLSILIDKALLRPVFGATVPSCPDDSMIPNEFGYTIDGAARALHAQHGADEEKWRARILAATKSGDLRARDPEDGAYYKPVPPRTFWERVSIADLNEWLARSGTKYELHDAPTKSGQAAPSGVTRQRIIDGFLVRRDPCDNRKFWDDKLSRPPNWLVGARVSVGKRGVSSLWNPALVAHGLLNRQLMHLQALDLAMENFPDRMEEWQEHTELDRY